MGSTAGFDGFFASRPAVQVQLGDGSETRVVGLLAGTGIQ